MGPPDLKKLLMVKLKPRQDPYCDQFSRILMVKLLMITATFTGLSWLKDKVSCIVPKNHDTTGGFVSKACWINGMYIYRDLKPQDSSYYYGIPSDITKDGINGYGVLCSTRGPGQQANPLCTGLEKTFFLQYQWFPMGVVCLSFLYYLPYLIFRFGNKDMQALKEMVKGKKIDEVDYETIISKFFKRRGGNREMWRILVNLLVKVLYVVVNVSGLLIIDAAMNGEFINYGSSWMQWLGLSANQMHDYTAQSAPKAGHSLLPGFALCQVRSEAQDIKTTYSNVHTYVCELSQHVLYQYILIVLWFMHVIGICVSVLGLLNHMFKMVWKDCVPMLDGEDISALYAKLSVRERELMDYIRLKNIPLFGELMSKLEEKEEQLKKNYHNSYAGSDEKQPMLS